MSEYNQNLFTKGIMINVPQQKINCGLAMQDGLEESYLRRSDFTKNVNKHKKLRFSF
jgi:hypothetical protein